MSPRSKEFFDAAHQRLATARGALDQDPSTAVSIAYYAMLYAARGALSERDTYAKTHGGTWHRFREVFLPEGFDEALIAAAQTAREQREQSDYEAWKASPEEAAEVIDAAARFLAAVERLIGSAG